jgi:hypothetical protein
MWTRPLIDDEPPSTLPRGVKTRRPFSAGSGSDSYAQFTSVRAKSLP